MGGKILPQDATLHRVILGVIFLMLDLDILKIYDQMFESFRYRDRQLKTNWNQALCTKPYLCGIKSYSIDTAYQQLGSIILWLSHRKLMHEIKKKTPDRMYHFYDIYSKHVYLSSRKFADTHLWLMFTSTHFINLINHFLNSCPIIPSQEVLICTVYCLWFPIISHLRSNPSEKNNPFGTSIYQIIGDVVF